MKHLEMMHQKEDHEGWEKSSYDSHWAESHWADDLFWEQGDQSQANLDGMGGVDDHPRGMKRKTSTPRKKHTEDGGHQRRPVWEVPRTNEEEGTSLAAYCILIYIETYSQLKKWF